MEYIAKNIPLWQVTTWDKKFNNVDRSWQPKTIKYNYLLSDELDEIRTDDGEVRILYTGKDIGYTTEKLAGDNLSEGEIVSIPWGGIPTVKYYKGKFVTGDNRIATSNDTSKLSNRYLYYFMKGHIHEIASYYRGASLKHPCMKDVLKMEISYPALEIQNMVCDQFDVLDAVIEQRSKELALLDNLVKARFVEMFGDPVDNPMEWEKKQLQEIVTEDCTISYGIVQTGDDQEEGVPVVRPVDIVNRIPKLEELKKTTKEISNKYKRTVLKGREMLITVRANIADTCIIGEEFKGCNVGRGIVPIKTQEDIIVLEFLKHLIDNKHLNDNIKSKAKGITLIQLNMEDLREVELIIPPIKIQKCFVEFSKEIDKSKFVYQ